MVSEKRASGKSKSCVSRCSLLTMKQHGSILLFPDAHNCTGRNYLMEPPVRMDFT